MNMFDKFPTGEHRRRVVTLNAEEISKFKKIGKKKVLDDGYYSWTDSSLEGGYDSSFYATFQPVLPREYKKLGTYIESVLAERRGHATGVEFGGLGSALFSGFSDGFFSKSFAVSLVDHRNPRIKPEIEMLNKKINHSFIEGDIFSEETYAKLNKKLEGAQVDLIIERMAKGLEFVPEEPYTVSRIIQTWYSMLREGGVMFVQTPVVFNSLLEAWTIYLKKNFKDTIEIKSYPLGSNDKSSDSCSSFRLIKKKGAPIELPFLDPRIVNQTGKY